MRSLIKILAIGVLVMGLNGCKNKSYHDQVADTKPVVGMEREPFSDKKILTVSARDYVESVGKKLSDYEMVGVHACIGGLENKVPDKAERVTDFTAPNCFHGTALIPKATSYAVERR